MKVKKHKIIIEEGELVGYTISPGQDRVDIEVELRIPGAETDYTRDVWRMFRHRLGEMASVEIDWRKVRKRLRRISERGS